jgi:hypothetical protein
LGVPHSRFYRVDRGTKSELTRNLFLNTWEKQLNYFSMASSFVTTFWRSEGYITGILLICPFYWGSIATLSKQGKNPTPDRTER